MSEILSNTRIQGKDILNKTKFLLNISISDFAYILLCYFMSGCVFLEGRTPFALSAYAASFIPGKWLIFFVSASLGIIRFRMDLSAFFYIAALVGATFAMGFSKNRPYIKALCISSFLLISSLLENIINSAYWYEYMITVIECVLCYLGVHIFSVAVPLIINAKERRYILDTEVFSVYVLIALIVRCTVNLPLFLGMDISVILSIILLLIINLGGGVSTSSAMGIVFGFVTGGDVSVVSSVGAFAFSSLCSGFLSRFGRWGVVLGFVLANTALAAFFPQEEIPFDIFEIMSAAIVFSFLPAYLTEYISSFPNKTVHMATKAFVEQDKIQNVIVKRLGKLSDSYRELSLCYDKCFENKNMSKDYIIHMLDTASARICPDCGLKYNCWERCYKESYKSMIDMLTIAEEKGLLDVTDVPSPLKDKCIKLSEFVKEFNCMYEVYKVEKIWQQKLNESRMLVSSQLIGVSRSIERVTSEFEMCLDTAAEKELKTRLDREKISVKDVTVLKGSNDGFRIEIISDKWNITKREETLCAKVIEDITGQKAFLNSKFHTKDGISFTYKPAGKYLVSVGSASVCRKGEKISGDSYIICENLMGETVAAISDGMGTGAKASVESMTATALLGNFISAGMDVKTSLELINSSLLLRSSGDSFATMDVCSVDVSDGTISLFKSGAATGYVKNEDGVFEVKSDSLPFGVLSDYGSINTEIYTVDKSCLVVMMSDGVADVLNMSDEKLIKSKLKASITDNPQMIASMLLNSALELSGGSASDDMTVLAVNVWQAS